MSKVKFYKTDAGSTPKTEDGVISIDTKYRKIYFGDGSKAHEIGASTFQKAINILVAAENGEPVTNEDGEYVPDANGYPLCDQYANEGYIYLANNNFDNLIVPGTYVVSTPVAKLMTNSPFKNAFIIEIIGSDKSRTATVQRATRYGVNTGFAQRTLNTSETKAWKYYIYPTGTIADNGAIAYGPIEERVASELGLLSVANIGQELLANTDLNDIVTPGNYYSSNATRTATLINAPNTESGFKLIVVKGYHEVIHQFILATGSYIWMRTYSGEFTEWKQLKQTTLADLDITADASEINKLDGMTTSKAQLNYLNTTTSNVQTQLDGKAPKSHAHGNITNAGQLGTASRVVVTDASKNITVSSAITTTELGYLDGVTSAIQTQLDNKASKTHAHTTSIAASTGTSELTLSHGSKYAITAGGDSFIFTMPSDNDTKVTQAYDASTNASIPLLFSATSGVTSTSSRGAVTAKLNNKFYVNPSTGKLTATAFGLANGAGILGTKPADTSSTGVLQLKSPSTLYLNRGTNTSLIFAQNDTAHASFDTSNNFIPSATDTYNIGSDESNGAKWKGVYATSINADTASIKSINKGNYTASINTAGWYRIFTSENHNSSGRNSVIFSLGRSYNSPKNEEYTFVVTIGYDGEVQIVQIAGVVGGHLIDKIRVLYDNGQKSYIEFHTNIGNAGANSYSVSGGIGDGTFTNPTLTSSIPSGYTAFEAKTGTGILVNGTAVLTLAGGTMTGKITAPANQYYSAVSASAGKCGIDMNNSDIIGANSIVFKDALSSRGEGFMFKRSSGDNYDQLYALDGQIYLKPNLSHIPADSTDSAWAGLTTNKVYHSGNLTFSYSSSTNVLTITKS